jgi:uncharacterized lipoprotein YbaY
VVRVAAPAAPPIRFELRFDPSRIDERHSYVVRARITHGD